VLALLSVLVFSDKAGLTSTLMIAVDIVSETLLINSMLRPLFTPEDFNTIPRH
jgi:hypothetical protein